MRGHETKEGQAIFPICCHGLELDRGSNCNRHQHFAAVFQYWMGSEIVWEQFNFVTALV